MIRILNFILSILIILIQVKTETANIKSSYSKAFSLKVPYNNTFVSTSLSIYIENKIKDVDFTIITFPKTPNSVPIIMLSNTSLDFNNESSLNSSSIFAKCAGFGIEICTIPEYKIQNDSTFYANVICRKDCEFDLQINYHIEQIYEIDNQIVLRFLDKTSQIIKIRVSEINKTLDRLIINARLLNAYETISPFHIFINKGNLPPTTSNYDYKLETTWHEGIGVSITKEMGEKSLCSNCNFTLLVEGDVKSMILISSELYGNKRNIQKNREIFDIVLKDQKLIYNLDFSLDSFSNFQGADLSIKLRPYSGNPSLYICPEKYDGELNNCKWSINEDREKELIIPFKEKNKFDSKWDLVVFGYLDDCSYSFVVSILSHGQSSLEFGLTESGSLTYNEILNYKLNLYTKEPIDIYINFIQKNGFVNLLVKRCPNSLESCEINEKDFESSDSEILINAKNRENNYMTKFRHDLKKCEETHKSSLLDKISNWFSPLFHFFDNEEKKNYCSYSVAVQGANPNITSNVFNFVLTYLNQNILLKEREIFKNSLKIHTFQYFRFFILNDSNIESVSFQITSISGEIIMYVSRNIERPDSKNYEKKTEYDFDIIEYKLENKNDSLKGNYFISIYSKTNAFYTITPIVSRVSNNFTGLINATLITETLELIAGINQKISYKTNGEIWKYFKFSLYYSETDQAFEGININLTPIQGKFIIYIGEGFLPNENNYTWTTRKNSFSINKSDPLFKNSKRYYISIKNQNDNSNLNQSFEYFISYSTKSTIIPIKIGIPIKLTLSKNDERHYFLDLETSYSHNITITKSNSDEVDIYVSHNNSNQFPTVNNSDFEIRNSSFQIPNDIQLAICKNKVNCKLYFTIISRTNVEFSLIIKFEDSTILLSDGISHELTIPGLNEPPFKLYAYIPKNKPISISTYSIYRKCFIYAYIIPLDNKTPKENWRYPTNISYEFTSKHQSSFDSSTLTITTSTLNSLNCNDLLSGCVITLRVYPSESTSYYSWLSRPTFSVVFSTEIIQLTTGVPHTDYVMEKAYKYYSIYVGSNSTLFISLTPISSGDPDLCVSYGEESRPTLDKYDWIVRTFGGEQIEITPEELKKKKNNTLPGTYVIGVFGFKNCSFSLAATFGNIKILKIFNGNPLELSLKPEQKIFLEYYHFLDNSFKILITETNSEVGVFINNQKSKEELFSMLPKISNSSSYKWTNMNSVHKNILKIDKNNTNFCYFCKYYLTFSVTKETTATILLEVSNYTNNLQSGKILNDWVDKNEYNTYYFFSDSGALDVSLVIYSGDPTVYVSNSYSVSRTNSLIKKKKSSSNTINIKLFKDDYSKKDNLIFGNSFSVMVDSGPYSESNYTIVINNLANQKFLKYGVLDFGNLGKGKSQIYTFNAILDEEKQDLNQTLTVNIVLKDNNTALNNFENELEFNYPQVEFNLFDEERNFIEKGSILKQTNSLKMMNFVLKPKKGYFFLNITNTFKDEIQFTVMLNNKNINMILPNHENFGIVPFLKLDNYEIYPSKPGKILIEVFECSGKLQLFLTNNYKNLLNNTYEITIKNGIMNHLVAFEKINKDLIFVGLKAIELNSHRYSKLINNTLNLTQLNKSININEAYYKISTFLLPEDSEFPYDYYYFNPSIQWNIENDVLNINFDTIRCDGICAEMKEYNPIEYMYILYVSNDAEILNSVIHCNSPLIRGENSDFVSLNYGSLFYDLKSHPNKAGFLIKIENLNEILKFNETKRLYIGIQTKILTQSSLNSFTTLTFIYNLNQITDLGQYAKGFEISNILEFIIAFFFVFLFIGTLCGIWFWRRYKKIKNQLEFEVQEVRGTGLTVLNPNLNTTESDISSKNKYVGFQDDKSYN